jgi:hypothetical protein
LQGTTETGSIGAEHQEQKAPSLNIKLYRETESSYSEVITRLSCYLLEEATELVHNPALTDLRPLNCGFKTDDISVDEKCYLLTSLREDGLTVDFPSSKSTDGASSYLLHGPDTIKGFDGKDYVLGVITALHGHCKQYIWYHVTDIKPSDV